MLIPSPLARLVSAFHPHRNLEGQRIALDLRDHWCFRQGGGRHVIAFRSAVQARPISRCLCSPEPRCSRRTRAVPCRRGRGFLLLVIIHW